jgi:RNA recognition motif-containing protein
MDTEDKQSCIQVDGVFDLADIIMKPEISDCLDILSTTLPCDNTPTTEFDNFEEQNETEMTTTQTIPQEEGTYGKVDEQKNYHHNEVISCGYPQPNLKSNSFEFVNNQKNDGHYQNGYGDPFENYSAVGEEHEFENDHEMSNSTQHHISMLESLLEINRDGNGNNTYTNTNDGYTNTNDGYTNTNDGYTNKLFICNIPFQMPEEELIQIFSEFGRIKNFKLINDTQGGRHIVKRYAFISYFVRNEMMAALSIDGRYMYNRKMVVRVFQPCQSKRNELRCSKITSDIHNRKKK